MEFWRLAWTSLVGHLGSVPGFGAGLGLDSVISNLDISLRWSSKIRRLPLVSIVEEFR